MRLGVIYKITSPTNKIYIGQSVGFKKRMSNYSCLQFKGQNKLKASIIKHGWKNHTVEIIEEVEQPLLNEREVFWIKEFNTFNTPHGMNLQAGGGGSLGRKLSAESIEKMASKLRGRKPSLEVRIKLSKSQMGRVVSPETRAKIGLKSKGRRHTNETKALMSEKKKGRLPTKAQLDGFQKYLLTNGHPMQGKKQSDEAKLKMSISKKGKPAWNKGVKTGPIGPMSDETKEKLRQAHLSLHLKKKTIK